MRDRADIGKQQQGAEPHGLPADGTSAASDLPAVEAENRGGEKRWEDQYADRTVRPSPPPDQMLFDQESHGVDIRDVRRHDDRKQAETGLLLQPRISERGTCETM